MLRRITYSVKQWRAGKGRGAMGHAALRWQFLGGRKKEKRAPNFESGWASSTNRVLELIRILQFLTTTSSFLVAL